MIIADYLHRAGYSPRGIVHVGAHWGQEMDAYCSLNPQRLVWIEAESIHAQRLRERVAAHSHAGIQTVIQALIADVDGRKMAFHRFSNDGESSSVFRGTDVLSGRWPNVRETGETITLTTSRLDTALQQAGVTESEIDVLVLDVQGAEIMALEGAGKFLNSVSYVEAEVSQEAIYEGGPLVDAVVEKMAEAGFRPMTEIPWHGDVVFAREKIR
jgi:FkbM family methyltransferase